MFLQIDVFPDNGNDATNTLFVSPANIINQDDPPSGEDAGRLVSIGRKDCDVLLNKDKTISRNHAALRLVSNDPKMKGCMEARNEQENAACQDSPLGMAVVMENYSAGNSYVIQPDKADDSSKKEQKKNKNDDDTDDETDDEGVISQQIVASQQNSIVSNAAENVSNAAKDFYGDAPFKIEEVGMNVTKVLNFEAAKDNTLFVQFGKSLLTKPTIRITLIPLRMAFSSSISSAIKKSMYLAGAVAMDGAPDETATHFVTKDVSPSAKVLIAWCRGVPMISPDYCKAMVNRDDMGPLPSPDLEFSKEPANRHALSKITFLSILPKSEDTEELAEAAGGTVVRLHDMFSKDADILHHVEALVKEQEEGSSNILVALEVPSKTKGVSRAKVALYNKVKKLGVRTTNAKCIAKAVGNKVPLQDTEQKIIVDVEEVETNNIEMDIEPEPEKEKEATEDSPDSMEVDEPAPEVVKETHKQNEDEPQQKKAASPKKRGNKKATEPEKATEESNAPKKMNPKPAPKPKKPMEKGPVQRDNADKASTQLEKADGNGWFSIAPKDENLRKQFRKKADKAFMDEHGLHLEQAAPSRGTVEVVDPDDEAEEGDAQANNVRVGQGLRFGRKPRANTGVANFKKFKKNYIAPVNEDDFVLLVEHVSEKTQKQREMNAQAQKLEEEQREADALFRGIGMENAPKKRRRKD